MQPMKDHWKFHWKIVPTPNVSIFQMLQFSKENDEPKQEDPECWVRGINQSLLQQGNGYLRNNTLLMIIPVHSLYSFFIVASPTIAKIARVINTAATSLLEYLK